jgi:hypothetical protein
MTTVRSQISVSLDGFVAGPNQSLEHPIGEGGLRLHDWAFATESWRRQHGQEGGERNADSDVVDDVSKGVGAYIMGRRMFGGGGGEWDESRSSPRPRSRTSDTASAERSLSRSRRGGPLA